MLFLGFVTTWQAQAMLTEHLSRACNQRHHACAAHAPHHAHAFMRLRVLTALNGMNMRYMIPCTNRNVPVLHAEPMHLCAAAAAATAATVSPSCCCPCCLAAHARSNHLAFEVVAMEVALVVFSQRLLVAEVSA
jgi:hypothetical protein